MSINSADYNLKKIYHRKYNNILDIMEEFDANDINEILKELSEPFKNSFISEIKEKIILNAQ
jgi:hypothetical protein